MTQGSDSEFAFARISAIGRGEQETPRGAQEDRNLSTLIRQL